MLGKIIKHEFKATYKSYFLLFASLIAITVLNKTVDYVPLDNTIWNIIKVLLMVAWILLLIFLAMGAMVLAVVRFYKTMVKDEGYLTHTLPVKKSQLIIGKFVTSLIWMVVSIIVMVASIVIAAMSTEFMEEIIDIFNEFANMISEYPQVLLHLLLLFLMCLAALGASLFQCYASVALGQMFSGHKIAGSILFYFILNYAISILSTAAMFITPNFIAKMDATNEMSGYEMMAYEGGVFDELMIMMIVLQIVCIAICFFITNYRFSKKLNLD